jgi:hypothetical protein
MLSLSFLMIHRTKVKTIHAMSMNRSYGGRECWMHHSGKHHENFIGAERQTSEGMKDCYSLNRSLTTEPLNLFVFGT